MQPDVTVPPPTQDERTMAMLMYILTIFAGWLSPLIFFFVKRDSKFVGFHALQTLFFHIAYLLAMIVLMVCWFAFIFATIATSAGHSNAQPPLGFFMVFPLVWGGWMLLWATNLLICIVFGIKANSGEWPALPLFGTWARRVIKV